jgi:hypothetical protein
VKWVPGVFPGDKRVRCVRLTTLPPSCAVIMKFGILNFLDPSGPLQACNGTALPLPKYFKTSFHKEVTNSWNSKNACSSESPKACW